MKIPAMKFFKASAIRRGVQARVTIVDNDPSDRYEFSYFDQEIAL